MFSKFYTWKIAAKNTTQVRCTANWFLLFRYQECWKLFRCSGNLYRNYSINRNCFLNASTLTTAVWIILKLFFINFSFPNINQLQGSHKIGKNRLLFHTRTPFHPETWPMYVYLNFYILTFRKYIIIQKQINTLDCHLTKIWLVTSIQVQNIYFRTTKNWNTLSLQSWS